MSNHNQVEYRKKCSRCGREILMRNVEGNKWQALETDGSEAHKCYSSTATAAATKDKAAAEQPQQIPTPRMTTDEDRIERLEKRVSKLERIIKGIVDGYHET